MKTPRRRLPRTTWGDCDKVRRLQKDNLAWKSSGYHDGFHWFWEQGWLKVPYNVGIPTFKYEKIELLVCIYEISRELVFIYGISRCSRCLTPVIIVNHYHTLKKGTENRVQAFIESTSGNWNPDSGVWIELKYCNYSVAKGEPILQILEIKYGIRTECASGEGNPEHR